MTTCLQVLVLLCDVVCIATILLFISFFFSAVHVVEIKYYDAECAKEFSCDHERLT